MARALRLCDSASPRAVRMLTSVPARGWGTAGARAPEWAPGEHPGAQRGIAAAGGDEAGDDEHPDLEQPSRSGDEPMQHRQRAVGEPEREQVDERAGAVLASEPVAP